MSETPSRFHDARLKLEWAEQHVARLKALWEDYLKSGFCQLEIVKAGDDNLLRIKSLRILPHQLVLTLGDALHNLRCPLDYAISEILEQKDNRLTFPMDKDKGRLSDSFGPGGRNSELEKKVPGIGKFIVDELKPYKGGDQFLWPLTKLDSHDKHKLLIPIVSPQTVSGLTVVDANQNSMSGATSHFFSGGIINLLASDAALEIKDPGKVSAKMCIALADVVDNKEAFFWLGQASKRISEALEDLGEFVADKTNAVGAVAAIVT